MRYKTNPVIFIVVYSVIVLVDWQTHDEERLISLAEHKRANRLIQILTYVNNVLACVHAYPVIAEEEVDSRQVLIALAYHVAVFKLVLGSRNLGVELLKELWEIVLRKYDLARSCVKN